MTKLFASWSFLILVQIIVLAGFLFYACGKNSLASETITPMKISSFDGINLIVKDYPAQKTFYKDVLGLPVESEYSTAIFFKIGDTKLGLFARGHHKEGDQSLEGATKGISHLEFGLSTEASKLIAEKLKKAGFLAYRTASGEDNFKDADGNLFHFNYDGKVNY